MNNKQLVLLTVDFPYGVSESSFLKDEIEFHSTNFDHVWLVPLRHANDTNRIQLPENATVANIQVTELQTNAGDLLEYFTTLFEEVIRSKNFRVIKNIRYHFSEFKRYKNLSYILDDLIKAGGLSQALFYTYWFDEWTSALTILKRSKYKDIKIVSRAHGYDLYEERHPKGYIFMRQLQLNNVQKVFCISRNGSEYLIRKYPEFKHKVEYSRLGIKRLHSLDHSLQKRMDDSILMVSCSQIIPIKRLDRVIDILKCITKKTRWVHFGDGELRNTLEKEIKELPQHVEVNLMGAVSNEVVRKYYSENYIDWFINTSDMEGLPVSMMEAISYGIPIIARNVGGVSEIVNSSTGLLLNEKESITDIINKIETTKFTELERKRIVTYWNENFDAISNFSKFSIQITNCR